MTVNSEAKKAVLEWSERSFSKQSAKNYQNCKKLEEELSAEKKLNEKLNKKLSSFKKVSSRWIWACATVGFLFGIFMVVYSVWDRHGPIISLQGLYLFVLISVIVGILYSALSYKLSSEDEKRDKNKLKKDLEKSTNHISELRTLRKNAEKDAAYFNNLAAKQQYELWLLHKD